MMTEPFLTYIEQRIARLRKLEAHPHADKNLIQWRIEELEQLKTKLLEVMAGIEELRKPFELNPPTNIEAKGIANGAFGAIDAVLSLLKGAEKK